MEGREYRNKKSHIDCSKWHCNEWKLLKSWLGSGHLPSSFFIHSVRHLAAQVLSLSPLGSFHPKTEEKLLWSFSYNDYEGNKNVKIPIECFHMTSRRPGWCPKPILWELNSFLTQTISFVPINLHRCWSREWKHSIGFHKQHKNYFACAACILVQTLSWVRSSRKFTHIWYEPTNI